MFSLLLWNNIILSSEQANQTYLKKRKTLPTRLNARLNAPLVFINGTLSDEGNPEATNGSDNYRAFREDSVSSNDNDVPADFIDIG